jgi:hypothetical protein
MKVLDECVDWRLSREIVGHDVKTARQMGWAMLKNGELLALAAQAHHVRGKILNALSLLFEY